MEPLELARSVLKRSERASSTDVQDLARAYVELAEAVIEHRRERYGARPGIGGVYAIDGRLYQAAGLIPRPPRPSRKPIA